MILLKQTISISFCLEAAVLMLFFVAPVLSQSDVCSVLQKLNPRKASGPDGVSNWILKEFAEILAQPVCSILDSSFAEQIKIATLLEDGRRRSFD